MLTSGTFDPCRSSLNRLTHRTTFTPSAVPSATCCPSPRTDLSSAASLPRYCGLCTLILHRNTTLIICLELQPRLGQQASPLMQKSVRSNHDVSDKSAAWCIMFLCVRISHGPPTQALVEATSFDITFPPLTSSSTHHCYDQLHLLLVIQASRAVAISWYKTLKSYFPVR